STTRSFDLADELNVTAFTDTRTQTFTYNAAGQPVSVSHGDDAPGQAATLSTLTYDLRGQPSTLSWHPGGTPALLATGTRNPAGLVTALSSPIGGSSGDAVETAWVRDLLGRVTAHEVTYLPSGGPATEL